MIADLSSAGLETGKTVEVDLEKGTVKLPSGQEVSGVPFSEVQMEIYKKGGLLNK